MTNYRRNVLAGGSYFFTVNLADRRHALLTDHIDLLRATSRRVHPFTIEAAVILPDRLHAIWTLPIGYADFATRCRLIKSSFSTVTRPVHRIGRIPRFAAGSGSVLSGRLGRRSQRRGAPIRRK